MDTSKIITELRAERDRLDQAITALESLGGAKPLGGDHEGSFASSLPPAALAPVKPKRNISPEGRARIIAATKARWARQRAAKRAGAGRNMKKGAKPAAKTAAPGGRTMSPAARKRIAEGMKKRWAEKKAATM